MARVVVVTSVTIDMCPTVTHWVLLWQRCGLDWAGIAFGGQMASCLCVLVA